MFVARQLVHATDGAYSFAGAIRQMLTTKPLYTMPLAAFLTFGPVLALLALDWRAAAARLWQDQYLGALLAGAIALAYIGGSDTERLLFWSAPVVYALIGHSLQAHPRLRSARALVIVLAAAQVISSRLLWGIPSPEATAADVASAAGLPATLYAVADRLLSLDAFYFNLWSFFADPRVRVVQLLVYLAGSVALSCVCGA